MQILNPPVSSAASVLTGDADPLGSAPRLTPKVWQAEKETRDEVLQRDGEEEIKPCWSEPVAAMGNHLNSEHSDSERRRAQGVQCRLRRGGAGRRPETTGNGGRDFLPPAVM